MYLIYLLNILALLINTPQPSILDINPPIVEEALPVETEEPDIVLVELNETNEILTSVQKNLILLNYYKVSETGILDLETQNALIDFKNNYTSLEANGLLTQKTLDSINTELESRYQTNPNSLLVLVNKTHYLTKADAPSDLIIPDVPFCIGEMAMREEAAHALEKMFNKAKEEEIILVARSGYRSFQTQEMVFARNVNKNGIEKANTYSAKPGQSEHQSGLAMDITARSVNNKLTERFEDTSEYTWLSQNAHLYGFILRYPKDRVIDTGYQYEPWHYRYVGLEPAKFIYNNNLILEDYIDKK